MSQYNTHIQAHLDKKDEAAMVKLMKSTLPLFSNEHDWEMTSFELALILDRVWPHKSALDICHYLQSDYPHYDKDMEKRADSLIYFALTLAAKKGSYAKLQILAACHQDAVPCVMRNEGRKLYQMFQSLFTMTTLHTANLPGVRKQFYDISQTATETVLEYTSRVDIIVATMAKLGEQVSPGAWIYALGHGLRSEYKDTKDGILYNKKGYETVLSVKTKILSEEAILKDKRADLKKEQHTQQVINDEIAMKLAASTPAVTKPTTDSAYFNKGKGGQKDTLKGNANGLMSNGRNGNRLLGRHQPTLLNGHHLTKAKENNSLNRSSGATFIRHSDIPQIGVSTIHIAQEDLPNGKLKALQNQNGNRMNGAIITRNTVTPLQLVARVKASTNQHPQQTPPQYQKGVRAKSKVQVNENGKVKTSQPTTIRPPLLFRLQRHQIGGTPRRK